VSIRTPLLVFYALAFAISWGAVLAVVGPHGFPGTTDQFARLLAPVIVAMLAGPSVAGVLCTAVFFGRAGLANYAGRLARVRVDARWIAIALVTAPLVVSAVLGMLALGSDVFRPGLVTTTTPARHLLLGLVAGLAAGTFEELGWTGFAIPLLRRRHGVFATGVIAGVLWGAWHFLVVWWGSTGSAGGVPMTTYLPAMLFSFLPPYRVLMVWVYDRTGSLPVAMLMHASLTASVRIFDPIGIAGAPIVTYNLVLGAALWLIVAAVVAAHRGRLDRGPV